MATKKQLIEKTKTTIYEFDDETVTTEVVNRDVNGDVLDRRNIVQQNKLTRVPRKDRKILRSKTVKEYKYDNGSKLVQIQEFRYTPKRQEKKLEREFVITEN